MSRNPKIKFFILFIALSTHLIQSQTKENYTLKANYLYGNILGFTKDLRTLIDKPVMGGEMGVEWQTMGEEPWHQYLNFPSYGISAVYLDLGNPIKLGKAFAVYPYLDITAWRTRYFKLYAKGGMGASLLTETYYTTNQKADGEYESTLTHTNLAIGSALNIYFAGGAGIEVFLYNGLKLSAEYTWNHCSNGSFVQPNSGINMINGLVGLKYSPNYKTQSLPSKKQVSDLSRKVSFEIIASGGARQLYYRDNYLNGKVSANPYFKYFPTASLGVSAFKPLTNYYRMGIGLDGFYDGAYDDHFTRFKRNYITSNKLENKLRLGLSWQNELIVGRITAGFHFGIYLYNPLKNLAPYNDAENGTLDKPLIYPYSISEEDGWFYSRAAFKYSINDHYFISLGLKTHLQVAEFIEWGVGYRF